MTRINTNVSSLIAQKTLARSNVQLQEALTRLSTGLRINVGKDDPAGLIASENLRSDIISVEKAITNSERANQLIAIADSALGQVSKLLNDIRGLVTEAANEGALSAAQIAANQLQIDSSLEAIDRIAQTTQFQGRKILDGSLAFITTAGTNFAELGNLQIDQANLGAQSSIDVTVSVTTAATQAQITNDVGTTTAATPATATLTLSTGDLVIEAVADGVDFNDVSVVIVEDSGTPAGTPTVVYDDSDPDNKTLTITVNDDALTTTADLQTAFGLDGNFTLNLGDTTATGIDTSNAVAASATLSLLGGDLTVTANTPGTSLNNVSIVIVEDSGTAANAPVVSFAGNTLTITVNDDDVTTFNDLRDAFDTDGTFRVTGGIDIDTTDGTASSASLVGLTNGDFTITANDRDAQYDDVDIIIATSAGVDATNPIVTYDDSDPGNKKLIITINDTVATTLADLQAKFAGTPFSIVGDGGSDDLDPADAGVYGPTAGFVADPGTDGSVTGSTGTTGSDAVNDQNVSEVTGGGAVAVTGGIVAKLVFQLRGSKGTQVFSFEAGATSDQIANAINLVSDSIGITAFDNAGTLELTSKEYGTAAFVEVEVISEETGGTFNDNLSATRITGENVEATVNGITAQGKGNALSINTASLTLSTTVTAGFTGDIEFSIDGGGALFQLGPNVVSNQQARIGVTSVNTARLGGVSGRLFELRSGGTKSLENDPTGAAEVVDQTITQVTQLRGRLGAFQRTTLDTNIASLNDTLANLTEAESSIRDADFAAESARLTRAQILVQSGTSVLQIANTNPQNVLALLR
jgi:flagellin